MKTLSRRLSALTLIAATGLLLATGCGGSDSDSKAAGTTASTTAAAAAAVTVTDPWVKAADTGMTAAFGTLVNHTSKPLTVVSATSDLSVMQLHEMVIKDGAMIMQEKKGGFVIPANGSFKLDPGGNHVMFMDLKKAIQAGDEVKVTLNLADGTTVGFTAVGKPYTGADESYAPGTESSSTPMPMNSASSMPMSAAPSA